MAATPSAGVAVRAGADPGGEDEERDHEVLHLHQRPGLLRVQLPGCCLLHRGAGGSRSVQGVHLQEDPRYAEDEVVSRADAAVESHASYKEEVNLPVAFAAEERRRWLYD